MNILSDEQLITDAVTGDRGALEMLVKRYFKPIYRFVFTYVKNQPDAEDITQETFVKVWRNLKKFDRTQKAKPWIYAIAKNTALDCLKKKYPAPFSSFEQSDQPSWLEQIASTQPLPEVVVDQSLTRARVQSAISKLSPKYSQIIARHHFNQLSFREISESTNEPLHTLKSRYRRALENLKKILTV